MRVTEKWLNENVPETATRVKHAKVNLLYRNVI